MSKAQSSIFPSADEAKAVEPGQFLHPKIFAQPFRLAFNRAADSKNPDSREQTVWIEVRTLGGLRKVSDMLQSGELVQIDPFSSMEMQLWGLLAEHCGFMRAQGNTSTLAAGIQPLGSGIATLAEDLASIMGGNDEAALQMLGAMQNTLRSRPCSDGPMEQAPLTHEFVKPDGVNLTEEGEDALLNLVHGTGDVNVPTPNDKESAEAIAFRKTTENAVEIFLAHTPPATPEEVEAEVKEAVDCQTRGENGGCKANARPPEGEVKTGTEAARVGRLVAEVARGLDNEEDEAARNMSETALVIFNTPDRKPNPKLATPLQELLAHLCEALPSLRDIPTHELTAARIADALDRAVGRVPGLEQFDVTMDDLKLLVVESGKIPPKTDPTAKSKIEPDAAYKAQLENLKKMMRETSEVDFARLVAQSETSEPSVEEGAAPDGPDGPHTDYVAPDPRDPYGEEPEGPQGKRRA